MTWKLIWKILSIILLIIGFAGFPDDIKQWKEWLKEWLPMLLGYSPVSWLSMLIGGSIFLYVTSTTWMKIFRPVLENKKDEEEIIEYKEEKEIIEQGVNLPKERVFSRRTPKELTDIFDGRTNLEAEMITKQHIGSWLHVKGEVYNISSTSGGSLMVYLVEPIDSPPLLILMFNKKKWLTEIQTLGKGDEIAAVGKIKEIEKFRIWLELCELRNDYIIN